MREENTGEMTLEEIEAGLKTLADASNTDSLGIAQYYYNKIIGLLKQKCRLLEEKLSATPMGFKDRLEEKIKELEDKIKFLTEDNKFKQATINGFRNSEKSDIEKIQLLETEIKKLKEENDRHKTEVIGEAIESVETARIIKLFRSLPTKEEWDKIEQVSRGACPDCDYRVVIVEAIINSWSDERLKKSTCGGCNKNPFYKDYSRKKWEEEARDEPN